MDPKPLIIIPYRDRATHLSCLTLHLQQYWPDIDICVCEQADTHVWNKGLLFNAVYRLLSGAYDYFILHDVDFIPSTTVDYSYTPQPTLLATECSQFNYQHCYDRFFGGVVGVNRADYATINGFSNQFRGWGGEDDSLYQSFVRRGRQPTKRMGNRFENFVHPRLDVLGRDKNNADYNHNLQLLNSPRDFSNGISNINDYIERYEVVNHNNYIHIKIHTHG